MADDEKEPVDIRPEIPGGIGETEFNIWKHLPTTRAYLKYLGDKADDAERAALDQWRGGRLQLAQEDELRGVVNTGRLAAPPNFDAIVDFYNELKAMEQAEQEANDPDRAEIERAADERPGPRRTGA